MARRYHGFATANPSAPRATGTCDRCGFRYPLDELVYQTQWAGNRLITLGIRVCTRTCYLEPNPQTKTILVPVDPVPVFDPRPENLTAAQTDYLTNEDGDRITTEDSDRITVD